METLNYNGFSQRHKQQSKCYLVLFLLTSLKLVCTSQSASVDLFTLLHSNSTAVSELKERWALWKLEHGKTYQSYDEELRRFAVWMENLNYIEEHNKHSDTFGYTLGMNHFGDIVSY